MRLVRFDPGRQRTGVGEQQARIEQGHLSLTSLSGGVDKDRGQKRYRRVQVQHRRDGRDEDHCSAVEKEPVRRQACEPGAAAANKTILLGDQPDKEQAGYEDERWPILGRSRPSGVGRRVRSRSRLPSARRARIHGRGRCRAREEGPRSDRNRRRISETTASSRTRLGLGHPGPLPAMLCLRRLRVSRGRYGIPPWRPGFTANAWWTSHMGLRTKPGRIAY